MSRRCLGFKLKKLTRPSGSTAWRVSGTLNGEQIKPEFDSKEAAVAEQERLDALLFGHGATLAPVITRLTPEDVHHAETVMAQLRQEFPGVTLFQILSYFRSVSPVLSPDSAGGFEAAYKRIRKLYSDIDLTEVCAWFLRNYQPSKKHITLNVAIEQYVAYISERHKSGALGYWQFRSIGFFTGRLQEFFKPTIQLGDLTTTKLQKFVDTPRAPRIGDSKRKGADPKSNKPGPKVPTTVSNKTKFNRRSYLIGFFKYCMKQKWIEANPSLDIERYRKKQLNHPEPTILTAAEAQKLMHSLQMDPERARLIPFFVFTLFCGVRPTFKEGEIARITKEKVDLRNHLLILRQNDTKTKMARQVKLQPNVVEWLKAYPLEDWPIIPPNFRKLYFKVRKEHGLKYDQLRHTFCSMLVGKFRSASDAAIQAGNSEYVMWSHYLNLVIESEAEAFWNIVPLPVPSPPQAARASLAERASSAN
jgi:integrase